MLRTFLILGVLSFTAQAPAEGLSRLDFLIGEWRGTSTGLVGRDGGVLERLEPPRMPKRVTRPLYGRVSFSGIVRTSRRARV